ncbi:MAG: hypothetical protein KME42_14225 [Tildeniella nuda ZEHNDER 1965/U140]|nr:hypothetical protein [Tildeniella nuda ZEHNDER 1965/U140]
MLFPSGVNPDSTNPGFPLGIDPATLLVLILITCLTFTPAPASIVTFTFISPSATLAWFSVLSDLTFTDRPTVEVVFNANHTACP